jgi:ubiquinone/menaquinone biosynthesis C-methylase UbiE
VSVRTEKVLTGLTSEELKIALDPRHPEHVLPPSLPAGARVLDVGCGAGQTLIAAYPDRTTFGLDIDQGALLLGKSLTSGVCFVCGDAEALPYASDSFDMVVARVSLPYMNLDPSIREMYRVLKPGGTLWITLHTFASALKQARRSSYKGWLFFGYIVLNSMVLHAFQKQFGFFGRNETFQTERAIRKLLDRNRFEDVTVTQGEHFVVTAHAR